MLEGDQMLCALAGCINRFYLEWEDIPNRRLSEDMRENLMGCLIKNKKDYDISRLLSCNNEGISEKYLEELSEN